MSEPGYTFTDRVHEQQRLARQAVGFDPLTERVFQAAGLEAGMRVLDLGSGAGDVAMLAARFVGPEGEVVGLERDPAAVASARDRVAAAGIDNVQFVEGDVQTPDEVPGTFDAVVGRLVLMYVPDPVDALRRVASLVRPGGLVCLHEGDLAYDWASPMTPLWTQIRTWFLQALERTNVPSRMGLSLYSTFIAAGLPAPEQRLECTVDGGERASAWGWANVIVGVLPLLEKLGIATADEVGADTLADRLLHEVNAAGGIVIWPPMVGAWSRTSTS